MRLQNDNQVIELADPAYEMVARGFKAWNFSPLIAAGPTTVLTSQSEIAVKVPTPNPILVTNIVIRIAVVGATLTSGQNLCTLYRQDGTLLSQTADQTAVWTTTGVYAMALGTPTVLTGGPGAYCWVGILSNGTTPATPRSGNGDAAITNMVGSGNGAGTAMWAGRIGAAVTAPASFTPSSLSTGAVSYWIGLS